MADKKTNKINADERPLAQNPFASLLARKTSLLPGAMPQPSPSSSSAAPPAAAATTGPIAQAAKLIVRKERKGHGGKTVTLVEGVPPVACEAVAQDLKKALGCGARVEGGAIVLQGELVDRVIAWLERNGARRVVRGS